MRKCSKCKEKKDETEFCKSKSNRLCKICFNSYHREWHKEAVKDEEYLEKERNKQRNWWEANREWGNKRQREYRKSRKDKKAVLLAANLRSQAKYRLFETPFQDNFYSLIGCTPKQWRNHLESLFEDGMGWDNYGYGEGLWTIDHTIPICEFDLFNKEEQQKAFSYLNTTPMWWSENMSKHRKLPNQLQNH